MLWWTFKILKNISGILTSLTGIKKIPCFFCLCIVISLFFSTFFPHFLQGNALNAFYILINTYMRLYLSHVWKKVQDEMADKKNVKKHKNFVGCQLTIFQTYFFNPKVHQCVMVFSNCAHRMEKMSWRERAALMCQAWLGIPVPVCFSTGTPWIPISEQREDFWTQFEIFF